MDIAVIGIAGRFPEAKNISEFYLNLKTGKDSVRDFSKKRLLDLGMPLSSDYELLAFLEDIDLFDHDFFNISFSEAQNMDPHQRILLEVVYESFENAGYNPEYFSNSNTSVFIGDVKLDYGKLSDHADPTLITGNLNAMTAGRVSRYFNLRGTSLMVDTTCSSSLVAIHLACNELKLGESDFAIVCGANIKLFPDRKSNIDDIGISSSDGKTRSYSADADGTGSGEAVACILLKPLEKALKENDHIHAIIKGSAVNQDAALSASLTAPSSIAQSEVIKKAWKNASIDPSTIAYIEGHGTGTKLGDPIEVQGIDLAFQAFTSKKHFCALSSVKSNIGHTNTAAGLSGFIKAVLSLKHQSFFPSLHFFKPNPFIDFQNSSVYVNNALREWQSDVFPRRAGVSSFGFSGTNCHVVLEENGATRVKLENGLKDVFYPIVISAKTPISLKANMIALADHLTQNLNLDLSNIAYTLAVGRRTYRYRFVALVNSVDDLINSINKYSEPVNVSRKNDKTIFVFNNELHFAEKDLNLLILKYPVFLKAFQYCKDQVSQEHQNSNFYSFVLQYSFYKLLESKGVHCKTFMGVGVGELVVAALTDNLPIETAIRQAINLKAEPDHNLQTRCVSLLKKLGNQSILFAELGYKGEVAVTLEELKKDYTNFEVISKKEDQDVLLNFIKSFYLSNGSVDWDVFYSGSSSFRIELPSYQFNRKRCWIDLPARDDQNLFRANPYHLAGSEGQLIQETSSFDLPPAATDIVFDNQVFANDFSWTITENKLANIWKEVLKVENLQLEDDFFDLGGHSLNGIQVINKIGKKLAVEIAFDDLFDYPTLQKLAEYLDQQVCKKEITSKNQLTQIEEQEWYEVTNIQKRIWLIHEFDPQQCAYNMPSAFHLSNDLNVNIFEKALTELVNRHESLRTSFVVIDGVLKQRISIPEIFNFNIIHKDLSHRVNSKDDITKIVYELAIEPFKLETGPLIKASLFKLEDLSYIFFFSLHHIIADGWSLEIIIKEITILYDELTKGNQQPLPPLKLQFKDYSVWINNALKGDKFEEDRNYWLKQFKTVPDSMSLPLDFPRPLKKTYIAQKVWLTLDKDISKSLRAVAGNNNATTFMVFTALLNIILYKYTQQTVIAIGTPVSSRSHPDLENQIGVYLNTVVIKTQFDQNNNFIELLQIVKERIIEAYSHQLYPFDLLVEELGFEQEKGRNILFDVGFTYTTLNSLKSFEVEEISNELNVSPINHNFNSTKADLWMHVNESAQEISLAIDYNIKLFKKSTIEKMILDFRFLAEAVTDEPKNGLSTLLSEVGQKAIKENRLKQSEIKNRNLALLKDTSK